MIEILWGMLSFILGKNRVENALNRLEGVSAKVNLKKKTAVVSMEKEVEDMQLQKAVEQAGYKVIQIR